MRYFDIRLEGEPRWLFVDAGEGETHMQAAQRAVEEAGAKDPMVVAVTYLSPRGRFGRRGFSKQRIEYYAEGGRVLTACARRGTCEECGKWTPNTLVHPWGYPKETGTGFLGKHWPAYCPACYRRVLGIEAHVKLPTKILFPEDGQPRCSCGGPLAITRWNAPWWSTRDPWEVQCARCGAMPKRRGARVGPERVALRSMLEGLRPVCFYQPLERCFKQGWDWKTNGCPWEAECSRRGEVPAGGTPSGG